MIDLDSFHELLQTLLRNKTRSFLTGFGVFWGVFMLVALIGGGSGMKELLNKNFEGFATNSAMIWEQATTKPYHGFRKGRYWSLTTGDLQRLRLQVPQLDVISPINSKWGVQAVCGDQKYSSNVKGLLPEYALVEAPTMYYGRFINEMDIAQQRKVCVIGKKVYKTLFPKGGDPCGELIRLDSVYYTVIGVDYSSGNMNVNGSAEESVSIPLSLMQRAFNMGDNIEMIAITARRGTAISDITPRIRAVIARAHDIDPTDGCGSTHLAGRHRYSAGRRYRCVEHYDGNRKGTYHRNRYPPRHWRHSARHPLADHFREYIAHNCSWNEWNPLCCAHPTDDGAWLHGRWYSTISLPGLILDSYWCSSSACCSWCAGRIGTCRSGYGHQTRRCHAGRLKS